MPVNASVNELSYNLHSETPNFGAYVSISENGILTVADFAPYNLVVYLSVKGYKITIVQNPAITENCLEKFEAGLTEWYW